MRTPVVIVLVLALAACTSADEQARQRDSAMIAQAIADSVAEHEFIEDSSKLAASITLDTVASRRIRNQQAADDADLMELVHEVVSPRGLVCALTVPRYERVVVGDTLSCQWAPAP